MVAETSEKPVGFTQKADGSWADEAFPLLHIIRDIETLPYGVGVQTSIEGTLPGPTVEQQPAPLSMLEELGLQQVAELSHESSRRRLEKIAHVYKVYEAYKLWKSRQQ